MKPPPSHICANKRKCRLCLRYRSATAGCQRPGGTQRGDRGFICAECVAKRT